jgi:hypothetical protein
MESDITNLLQTANNDCSMETIWAFTEAIFETIPVTYLWL